MLGDQNQCQQSNAQRGATKLWNIATQQNVANNKIEAAAVFMYTCYHLGDLRLLVQLAYVYTVHSSTSVRTSYAHSEAAVCRC